jgi:hypothetical protein
MDEVEKLLKDYEIFKAYFSGDAGTAVLVKKGGPFTVSGKSLHIGGGTVTGGTSKTACAVPVTLPNGEITWFVSLHLTYSKGH